MNDRQLLDRALEIHGRIYELQKAEPFTLANRERILELVVIASETTVVWCELMTTAPDAVDVAASSAKLGDLEDRLAMFENRD